jgi:hypothetical protein
VKQAKNWLEKRSEVWDILDEVIREYPVPLNRAPTLHHAPASGVRAGADRGRGDPTASVGVRSVQR